ncbi:hypothetical protein [Aquimarina longa]|uniref:hypothetical protein n=1 Tax=Aquimarina longa TaxID=1080221 RepID=UPI0007815504|nr:hypothetical protein [Aquimarina longa]
MNIRTILSICITFLLFINCSSDDQKLPDEKLPEKKPNGVAKILSFTFLAKDNEGLAKDVLAKIDHNKKEITVIVPANTNIERLKPALTVSKGVILFPEFQKLTNFTKPVVYPLHIENSPDVVKYVVIVSVIDSTESRITGFNFLASDNSDANLLVDVPTTIDGNTITAHFTNDTDVTALIPKIMVSNGATVVPNDGVVQNFMKDIEYIVTAQDGVSKTKYTVHVEQAESDNNQISSFVFSNISGKNYEATIDGEKIHLVLPSGISVNNLTPTIKIEKGAKVVPESGETKDFSDIVSYVVTAQDGSKRTYSVNVYTKKSLKNDRAVLEDLYKKNRLGNRRYFNWDLEAPNMNGWEGVTLKNGRVSELQIPAGKLRIYNLPASIGELSELEHLTMASVYLTKIPAEIGALKKLKTLSLFDNKIAALPKEIGDLESLENLDLRYNSLSALPVEVGKLRNLESLSVSNTSITELPRKLAEIPSLLIIYLMNTPKIIIPKEICDRRIQLLKDATDTCER